MRFRVIFEDGSIADLDNVIKIDFTKPNKCADCSFNKVFDITPCLGCNEANDYKNYEKEKT